jgi:DNA polymerase sigma
MRVNDFYTYRWLNLDKISQNLIFDPDHHLNTKWTGPKKASECRLEIIEFLKHARVPIVKMRDKKTKIEFDLS